MTSSIQDAAVAELSPAPPRRRSKPAERAPHPIDAMARIMREVDGYVADFQRVIRNRGYTCKTFAPPVSYREERRVLSPGEVILGHVQEDHHVGELPAKGEAPSWNLLKEPHISFAPGPEFQSIRVTIDNGHGTEQYLVPLEKITKRNVGYFIRKYLRAVLKD